MKIFLKKRQRNPYPKHEYWVDVFIGKRIRNLRLANEVTQGELADALGISFQQVQKYESGENRVAASRLWQIARLLHVDINELLPRGRTAKEVAEQVALIN